MSYGLPHSLRQLVYELSKLPSIGEKSALRLAYHLITKDRSEAYQLAQALREAHERTRYCRSCFAFTETELCTICEDPQRERRVICVVEKPADVVAIERSNTFRGLYHVLHGLWAPLKGVTPEHVRIRELVDRVRDSRRSTDELIPVTEIILATGTTVEGDATALFIANAMAELGVKITRIAQGLPRGGELEYADEITLVHAIDGRQSIG